MLFEYYFFLCLSGIESIGFFISSSNFFFAYIHVWILKNKLEKPDPMPERRGLEESKIH